MEITINLSPNIPGLIYFTVIFRRETSGQHDQKIDISGDLPETDEPLSVLRQKAQAQAKNILLAFAEDLKSPAD